MSIRLSRVKSAGKTVAHVTEINGTKYLVRTKGSEWDVLEVLSEGPVFGYQYLTQCDSLANARRYLEGLTERADEPDGPDLREAGYLNP